MKNKIEKIVWTRKAKESLNQILDYRYKDIPKAREIVKKDILNASKNIVFNEQYQKDDVLNHFRRIIVRDYKLIYINRNEVVFILNVFCTKTKL